MGSKIENIRLSNLLSQLLQFNVADLLSKASLQYAKYFASFLAKLGLELRVNTLVLIIFWTLGLPDGVHSNGPCPSVR